MCYVFDAIADLFIFENIALPYLDIRVINVRRSLSEEGERYRAL